jgi:hypothetical protein
MLDKSEQRLIDDIARIGWHLMGIPADAEGPSFVYSIGMMETLNHPEIIMFGLDVELMARVINTMGRDIRGGRSFVEPVRYDGLIERYACKTLRVDEEFQLGYFGYALWYRHHIGKEGTLQAVQCFWPDKQGLFPDEPGCNPNVVRLQPRLQRPAPGSLG